MSEETLDYHYGKHLQTYIDNINRLVEGSEQADLSLEELVKTAEGPVYNNAAQAWNHTFFFESLTPQAQPMPELLSRKLIETFGSVDMFMEQFTAAAVSLFGSGWTWLVVDRKGRLSIVPTANAGNPLRDGCTPLLTVDVWEHAYYIDYRNRRADYLKAFWTLVDWDKVAARLPRE